MTDLLLNNGEKVLWILTTSHADGTKLAVSSPDAEFVCQKIMAIEQHIRNNGPTSSGGKHLKLVQRIETYLKRIEFLGIFGTADEQLNYVALDAFSSLKKLRLDMCPLTTVQALLNYRDQLELLHVTNTGIPDLQKAFAPIQAEYLKTLAPMILPDYTPNIPPNFLWSKLHTLRLSNCGISRIDKAMHFFPSLKFLDLSHNSISHVVHLQDCFSLRYIDLSNNRIRVLSNLERVLGRVTRMSVANNKICSLDGLDKIYSLERIDVSGNYVDDFNEIQALIRLPCLEHVRLLSNPIEKFTDYRINFFKQFLADPSVLKANRSLPTLDGRAMKKAEKKKLRRMMFTTPMGAQGEHTYADGDYLNRENTTGSSDRDDSDVEEDVSGASFLRGNTETLADEMYISSEGTSPTIPGIAKPAQSAKSVPSSVRQNSNSDPPAAQYIGLPTARSSRISDNISEPRTTNRTSIFRNGLAATAFNSVGLYLVSSEREGDDVTPRSPKNYGSNRSSVDSHFTPESLARRNSIGSKMKLKQRRADLGHGSKRNYTRGGVPRKRRLATIIQGESINDCPSLEYIATIAADRRKEDAQIGVDAEDDQSDKFSPADIIIRSVKSEGPPSLKRETSTESSFYTYTPSESPYEVKPQTDITPVSASVAVAETVKDKEAIHDIVDSKDDTQATKGEDNKEDADVDDTSKIIEENGSSKNNGWTSVMKKIASKSSFSFRSGSFTDVAGRTQAERDSTGSQKGLPTIATNGVSPQDSRTPDENDSSRYAHNGMPLNGNVQIDEHNATNEEEEEMSSSLKYVGDSKFLSFSVVDNFELYIHQQVFNPQRPSGSKPYLSSMPKNTTTKAQNFVASLNDNLGRVEFLPESSEMEEILGIYAIHIVQPTASNFVDKNSKKESASSSITSDTTKSGMVSKFRRASFGTSDEINSRASSNDKSYGVEKFFMVISSVRFYLIDYESIAFGKKLYTFYDAPVPLVYRYHKLECLSVCTIFFGFQRCVFGFTSYGPGGASGNSYGPNTTPLISRSTESTGSDGGGVTVETNGYNADISPSQKGFRDDSQFIAYYYGIITQDKSATYPIISRVPQIANRLRKMSSSPLRNVKIENKDSALLQSIIDYLKGKKGDSDVNHYQMVYQVWRKQPGVKAARSIILTRTHLLLCDEDLLEARDVKITVLESYTRKELNKAYIEEESPLFITLVFKPSSVFSASKKWRLFIESRDAAAKLLTHCQDMIDDK